MAEVLANLTYYLHLGGILPGRPHRLLRRMMRHVFGGVVLILPQIIFIAMSSDHVFEVTFASYIIITAIGTLLQVAVLILYEAEVVELHMKTRRHVNKCENEGLEISKIYVKTEANLKCISQIMEVVASATCVIYVMLPAVQILYAIVTDSVDENTYFAPFFNMYYFFDATKSPAFEITYILYACGCYSLITSYIMVGQFYLSLCMYSMAMYEDLFVRLRSLDMRGVNVNQRRWRIQDCVRLHMDLLSYMEQSQNILNLIIFVEFVYELATLTLSVFTISFIGFSKGIIVLATSVCLTFTLFIYCWFGSLVIDKGEELPKVVYDLKWYNYTSSEIKMLQLIMVRTKINPGFGAFNYVYCTAITFNDIISNVFSALAFLKSII